MKEQPMLDATINCEKPNNGIYKFEGNMELKGQQISLGPENMLLRGSILRNTESAFGISIFTGHDTKMMQNAAKAVYKSSSLEDKTYRAIGIVLLF
jgi:magnesium-transporting ATPase (P-type)